MSTPVALACCKIISIIMQVCLYYKVILNVQTFLVVYNIMGSVYEKTKVIPKGPEVNPGRLGRSSNIFINYAGLLCMQCNIKCFNCCNCFNHYGKCL
jgi:hypothetical protein